MMEKVLKLYIEQKDRFYLLTEDERRLLTEKDVPLLTEQGESVSMPFPNGTEQVVIGTFEYTVDRMGGVPKITATVKHSKCLDDLWSDNVYAEFMGEKYYVMNTPSSSKDNEDARYSHDIELLSEREVLNHVYFIDAVQGDSSTDIYKSNSSSVHFFGDINEFVARLNSCLSYFGLGYSAVIDEGVTSDDKEVSFEDKYILDALQEIFNVYEIPYYFVGKVIHIGYTENTISYPFKYGYDGALLSISKENANYAVINKIKGQGSSDNIPYYYPNSSPKGDLGITVGENNKGITASDVRIIDSAKFADVDINSNITYVLLSGSATSHKYKTSNSQYTSYTPTSQTFTFEGYTPVIYYFAHGFTISNSGKVTLTVSVVRDGSSEMFTSSSAVSAYIEDSEGNTYENGVWSGRNITFDNMPSGSFTFYIAIQMEYKGSTSYTFSHNVTFNTSSFWQYNGKETDLSELGLKLADGAVPSVGDIIRQDIIGYITPMPNLMPSIYRESKGAQQFYEAKNNTYPDGEGGYYEFENEYSEDNQRQGTTDFEDIKPTIVGITNASGQRIDMFTEFAYDLDDNDDTDNEGNYLHPYFFAKLRKLDGDNGFNLFEQASESDTMQISFTSGVCGACTFEIGVGEETNKNIVQVDDDGNLKRNDDGNVLWENQTPQDRQNDTRNYEVWIALKKDDSTYGQIMPNKSQNLRPSVDDTFVILNINLPLAYITAAEKKLEQSLIKYMWENNKEKFTFSVKFSRIFFTEHPEVLEQLNENSRVLIEYNGQQQTLYVDNFTYKVDSETPLPEIDINLVDKLSVGKNSLQTQLDSVKQDILSTVNSGDFLKQGLKYFLRKDVRDYAQKLITFLDGANFGTFVSSLTAGMGGNIDGRGNAEFESLRVRSYMEVMDLIVNRLSALEGDQLLTEADTIESVIDLGGGLYRLQLKRKWDGYYTAQAVNNVIKGIYNTLDKGSGTYYTSWMRINSVNTVSNSVEVTLYADEDTPAGQNFPPCAMMKIARWGNQTDEKRQTCLYLSSTEGRIVKLVGVTKPIIDKTNYGAVLGTPPEFLDDLNLPLRDGRDYMYVPGVITTDMIRIDYQGKPISEIVDRGEWSADETYYHEELNPDTGVYETSDVWHNNAKYRCQKTGTKVEPSKSTTDWALLEEAVNGESSVSMIINSENVIFTKSGQGAVVTVEVYIGGKQLTYGDGEGGTFQCSGLGESSNLFDGKVYWGFKVSDDNKTFSYLLTLQQKTELSETVAFTVKANGVTYNKSLILKAVYDGTDGTDGENSYNFVLSQDNIVNKKSEYSSTYQLNATLYDGTQKVNINNYQIEYSSLPEGVSISMGAVDTSTTGINVAIDAQTVVNSTITFNAVYEGVTLSKALSITTVEGGVRGEKGATLRGPQDWKGLGIGYQFYSGGEGEKYLDVVIYNNNYYLCIKSHVKTDDNYPTSSTDNTEHYWQLGDKIDLVATKVLLSQYICVENLGAEAIEMKDADGNIVFLAKDGNVTCKTGTFENVDVSGIVRAKLMYSTIKKLLMTDADSTLPYNIDPVNAPCDTIFITTAAETKKWIYLPDAETYEGMELSFFHSVLTPSGLGEVHVACINNQRISYNTTAALINGIIVPKKAESIGYIQTSIKLVYNEFTKLKAISGTWYVISGVVTEE